MGIFNALTIFLQPLSILWCSTILFFTSEIYFLFFLIVMDEREFDLCVPHIYNPVEQKVMAGQFHAPSHPGVLKNVNMNGNILQRYFTHKNF